MHHQSQRGFRSIFIGVTQNQKCYLIYVPSIHKIVCLYDVVFSSALAYSSRPYSEALATQPEVSYIPYATSYHEQTVEIITFAQFEENNLVGNKRNVSEDESILDSIDDSSTDHQSQRGFRSIFIGVTQNQKCYLI